jgi:hypothetical protein
MWLVVVRQPKPDAPQWTGRHLLAAVDAVAWPIMWVILINQAPAPVGVVGPFATAVSILFGLGRLHRALCVNHRYWFTTWRWGRIAAAFFVVGMVMKVVMVA